ncbi:MAG TPA: polyprenol phosphomannose-dependent alpha 1,6 mannosyltransferase MptB, partial [Acidimicrobiales bacterium]
MTSNIEAPSTNFAQRAESPHSDAPFRLGKASLLGLMGTLAVVIGALLGGRNYETHLPGAWFFGMPGGFLGSIGSNNVYPPALAVICVFGGLILLTRVWLSLMRQLKAHPGFPVRKVVLVVAIWALPLLVAPPLFSRDVYSYAGQGEMVSHHINPYDYGTGVLGVTPFSTLPDVTWTNTPTPYGPTFLTVDGALARLSGHEVLPDLLLLRLLEVASLALIMAALPTLARSMRRDPAETVLLGAGCPLVLMALVGGAHNDALMIALLVAGLALARRVGTVPGIILCALAAGVKSPAALGVLFLGWVWAGRDAKIWQRLGHTAAAGVIGLLTMEAMAVVSGTGWGWLKTSTAADQSFTGTTPVDAVARFVTILGDIVRVHLPLLGVRTVISIVGLSIAAAFGLWLLQRAPYEGIPRTLGLTLLVVALLGPILWSWYVTWGVIVLAPAASPTLRKVLIAIITFETFIGASKVDTFFITLYRDGLLASMVTIAALFALVIIPLAPFNRWHLPT